MKKLLLASPFGSRCVLGVDPGLRTGCKVALVDKKGQFISHTVLKIQGEKAEENAKKLVADMSEATRDVILDGIKENKKNLERFISSQIITLKIILL